MSLGSVVVSVFSQRFGPFSYMLRFDEDMDPREQREEILGLIDKAADETKRHLLRQALIAGPDAKALAAVRTVCRPFRRRPELVLRHEDCSVLPLVLEGRWWDMIKCGEKREEYRECSPYWDVRIRKWMQRYNQTPNIRHLVVALRRGYGGPTMYWECCVGDEKIGGRQRHPEWGEPKEGHHYVIKLNVRVRWMGAETKDDQD